MTTQKRSGRKTLAIGGALVGVLVLLLLMASQRTARPSDATSTERAAPGVNAGALTASLPSSAGTPLPGASASATSSVSTADALSPRARRMRDDWCGYGLREGLREAKALEARNHAARQAGQPVDEAEESDAEKVLTQAREERLGAWIRTLRSRRDLRSQAIADLLAKDPGSTRHLHDLARRSTDPMITALALMRPCQEAGCRGIDAAQWARLEPDNLMAWIAQVSGGDAPTDQLPYLIERMGRDALRSEDYLGVLAQTLATLANDAKPGLQQMADNTLLATETGTYPTARLIQVMNACSPPLPNRNQRSSCEHIGELLWGMQDQLSRSIGLSLARGLVPPGHPRRREWEQRALHFDAATEALMTELFATVKRRTGTPEGLGCQAIADQHAEMRRMLQVSQWEQAEQALAASPESPETLQERAHAKRGGASRMETGPRMEPDASRPGR